MGTESLAARFANGPNPHLTNSPHSSPAVLNSWPRARERRARAVTPCTDRLPEFAPWPVARELNRSLGLDVRDASECEIRATRSGRLAAGVEHAQPACCSRHCNR